MEDGACLRIKQNPHHPDDARHEKRLSVQLVGDTGEIHPNTPTLMAVSKIRKPDVVRLLRTACLKDPQREEIRLTFGFWMRLDRIDAQRV